MEFLKSLVAQSDMTLKEVMIIISENKRGICFILDNEILVGLVTDGDIRRAIVSGSILKEPISKIMVRDFISLPVESDERLIRETFKPNLKLIPLIDNNGCLVGAADQLGSHRIPLLEPFLKGMESQYVLDCLETNWISSQGEYVRRFEQQFKVMHSEMESLAVCNGTIALHLALLALGIKSGDEVIVPDITFAATANSVIYCGAKPVFCEINKKTWCIEPNEIRKLITTNTKAIIPVHLYGQVCNMNEIISIAKENKLLLIEDCAEALGSKRDGRPVGTFGDAATFSFYGNKTISTGEGGMVLFKDKSIASEARIIRDHGMKPDKRYWHEVVGYNYRLTNLQAALGVAQFENLDNILARKKKLLTEYQNKLMGIKGIKMLPYIEKKIYHSNWLYTLILEESIDRDRLIRNSRGRGVDIRPTFYPLHKMPPYEKYRKSSGLEISNNIASNGICLPSSASLRSDELIYVVDILKDSILEMF
ncbi:MULTISPECIES: aminotransferase class I/II-fold pyridoxal phosphate-dependent enzyme [Prochlorococcus]|uniref:aminotransferase class I/II-fold pyridoxal phosphate-dependent enzyme n=1 Tax=Prochlorococcus TaxID=1218 RepID=UPI0005338CB7|nr:MULTISPECIES: aminotransferase class I/II-fold pyridoxal phosphate-dependent enzyme [Prochlorococcus]KGG12105.1 Bacillosamine/Legionaminic acid biosynthesis aminotransferase PglE [Prochlorococcus sp. MIT 0601]